MTIQTIRRWSLPGSSPAHRRERPRLAVRLLGIPLAAAALLVPGRVAPSAPFVLDLPGEGTLPGGFVPAGGAGPVASLLWQSPAFARPFDFRLGEVIGIRDLGPQPPADPDAEGFRCRLHGGDAVDGDLLAIDADSVRFWPTGGGEPVLIPRSLVMVISRKAVGEATGYVGPAGLNGWDQQPASSWREEAGRLAADRANATVSREVGGVGRARYDIVLSWQKRPELVVAVAAGAGGSPDAYRFEMLSLDGEPPAGILVRQEQGRGGIEEVPLTSPEQGRLRLSLFVDQAAGRLAAVVADADEVVELAVPPAAGRPPAGRFRLTVRSGDVCLDSLRVTEWSGAEPLPRGATTSQVVTSAGEIEGEIESLDGAAGTVVVRRAGGPETVAVRDVQELRFPGEPAADAEAADPRLPSVRLVQWGGGVISGEIVAVTDAAVMVAREGVDGTIPVPLADLRSLASLRSTEPVPLDGRSGRLVMEGVSLPGALAGGAPEPAGIGWQPQGSSTASGFAPAALEQLSAVVDYVPPQEPREDSLAGMVDVGGIGGAVNQDENGGFVITMLAEEGAAARDGRIEPGDRIVAVRPVATAGFVDTRGLDLETVMNLLRGRVGTPVSLRLESADGGDVEQIDLERGLIYVAERAILDQALAAHARLAAGQVAAAGEAAGFPSLMILRSGDVVAGAVEAIAADGVKLRSPVTASRGREPVTVAHPLVQAVELDPSAASRPLDRAQWQRLLTLPRSQRDKPPTHLLRLRSGDYLRGNLESLTADGVEFRVLGQRKHLPREAVVRVIWLHPEELDLGGEADAEAGERRPDGPRAEPSIPGLVVQAVSAGGERTTLVADRVEGTSVVGMSPAFGPSRIDTERIDRLLVARAVAAAEEELPYSRWKLTLAPEPRALRESGPED